MVPDRSVLEEFRWDPTITLTKQPIEVWLGAPNLSKANGQYLTAINVD